MIDTTLKIIEEFNLGFMIRWILENNTAQSLPYHNFSHSLWVANYAQMIYTHETNKKAPKELIIAALFHDFDHSGGFFKDDLENIFRAVRGYIIWADSHREFDETFDNKVINLIRQTQYPHLAPATSFEAACLRDADLLQNCNDTLFANFTGIKQEMFREIPYPQYMDNTLKFLRSIEYKTTWGKLFGKELLDTAINQLEQFKQLVFRIPDGAVKTTT